MKDIIKLLSMKDKNGNPVIFKDPQGNEIKLEDFLKKYEINIKKTVIIFIIIAVVMGILNKKNEIKAFVDNMNHYINIEVEE